MRWSTTKRPPCFWFDMCQKCVKNRWSAGVRCLLHMAPYVIVGTRWCFSCFRRPTPCEKHVMSCPLSMPVLPEFHFARSSFLLYFPATSVTCRIPWRPQTVNFPFLGRTPGSQWNHKMAVPLSKEFFLQDQWNHIIRLFFDDF